MKRKRQRYYVYRVEIEVRYRGKWQPWGVDSVISTTRPKARKTFGEKFAMVGAKWRFTVHRTVVARKGDQ